MSCKKAQGFLAENHVSINEQIDARKTRMGPKDALALADRATRVVVAKGSKVVTIEREKGSFDEKALLAAIIGPTGSLRAPTLLRGDTLVVGFGAEMYARIFP